MVTKTITEALRVSSEFANKLDDLVAVPGGFAIDRKSDWMLASHWYLNAALHNSVLTLFQANLPAGAFALLRPIVENLFRVHLLVMGEPDVLLRLESDTFRLNFSQDAQRIDDHFKMEGEFKSIVDQMVHHLHSFTHLGLEQMRRQFSSGFYGWNLEANYPEHEIVSVAGMSTTVKFMVTSRIIERFRTDAEQQIVLALLREFGGNRIGNSAKTHP